MMVKTQGQKLKLCYLRQIMQERSDEQHPLTMKELIAALAEQGISAERKSIYADLDALRSLGVKVVKTATRPVAYYIDNRLFDIAELQLIADSVEAAAFVTEEEARRLIGKLSQLTSIHLAEQLQRPLYLKRRVKSADKQLRQKLEMIFAAIAADRQICFAYRQHLQLLEHFTHKISPFAVAYNENNYYLLGFNARTDRLEDFSLACIQYLEIDDLPREGKDLLAGLDIRAYFELIIL